jgi:transposase InsO family protein
MCKTLEISKSRTTPYHPQSDGMVERFNRTLEQMLSMFVDENHDDLPFLTMAYRACTYDRTHCTPNLPKLGTESLLPIDIMTGTHHYQSEVTCPIKYVEWRRDAMQRAFDIAHDPLQASFYRQKKYHDVQIEK